ncbi:MAG: type II toxin-antitoxin system HicB family antitoxin [Chloroflexi bacterium]|nr:type II toxin-antitoxin system HicB family antitoxin [Chloroflexota bacterium]
MSKKKQSKTSKIKVDQKQVDYYLSLPYTILLSPLLEDDGGGFAVGIPELEGCHSYGKTPNKAVKQIKKSMAVWIAGSLKLGDEIPLPNNLYTETTEAP